MIRLIRLTGLAGLAGLTAGGGGWNHAWRGAASLLALMSVLVCGTTGCSTKAAKKGSGAAEKLPAIDPSTAFAVDEDRIAVSSPTGWTRLPRSKDCLVKYQPGPKKSYPKILVTAAAAPEGFVQVTPENHQDFAAGIAAGVQEALGKSKPLKKPVAIPIGPHLGVAWGIPGSVKVDGIQEPIDRWSYAVVIGGRMYTVEARAPKGKVDDAAKSFAKAMAAALAPPSAAAAAEETVAEDKPAGEVSPLDALGSLPTGDEATAEAKPAETKPADEDAK
ncbi:MAG: hypothetical protein WCH77_04720 [Planctomycetota bacterium]